MITRIKKINTALPGLLFGIILFGALSQTVGFFLVEDKADFSKGLWIGVVTAVFMAFHMAISLNSAVYLPAQIHHIHPVVGRRQQQRDRTSSDTWSW